MSFAKFRDAARESAAAPQEPSMDVKRVSSPAPRGEALISSGSKITGKLYFEGAACIEGQVDGEISAQGKLTLGEGAVINAKVSGGEVVVKGQVKGDIVAATRLALESPARVTGNICAPVLSIEEGVAFEGNCRMAADSAAGGAKSAPSGD